jgi:hypothetical protein
MSTTLIDGRPGWAEAATQRRVDSIRLHCRNQVTMEKALAVAQEIHFHIAENWGGKRHIEIDTEFVAEWVRVERWLYRNAKGSQLHGIVWEMMGEVSKWMRGNPPPDSWTVECWARTIDSIEVDILANSVLNKTHSE